MSKSVAVAVIVAGHVVGSAAAQTNVAPAGTATASSAVYLYGPERAIDGVITENTEFCNQFSGAQWWNLELDRDYLIDSIIVYPAGSTKTVHLTILDDGTHVYFLPTEWTGFSQTFSIGGIVGDTVRFEVDNDFIILSEVEVLGAVIPEPATMSLLALGAIPLLRRKKR